MAILTLVPSVDRNSEYLQSLEARAALHRTRTDKYRPVSSDEVLSRVTQVVRSAGFDMSTKLMKGRALKATTHVIECTLNNSLTVFGDVVKPRFYVKNSYNGESALTLMGGLMRLVCLNGLVAGQKMWNERIIHVKGHTLEDKLIALEGNVAKTLEFINGAMLYKIEAEMDKQLTYSQEMEIVKKLELSERSTKQLEYFRSDRGIIWLRKEDRARNVWSLYNVANEVIRGNSRNDMGNFKANEKLMDNVIKFAGEIQVLAA